MKGGRASRLRTGLRVLVLGTVVASPWAFGSVHPQAYAVLLAVAYIGGLASWARGHWGRAHGEEVARVPGAGWLMAFLLLGVVQLVPMPEGLLRVVSPGSHSLAAFASLAPQVGWRPISVSPPDTLRAVAFIGGMSLLYGFSHRELRSRTWRNRAAAALVTSSALMSVEALIQARSSPATIYGLYHPRWDWAVFGPFMNKNHFGGYIALAFPLALAWSLDAWWALRHALARPRGYLVLGDPTGTDWLRRTAVVALLAFSLVACRSRGALAATLVAVVGPLAVRRRTLALLAPGVLAAGLVALVSTETLTQQVARGARDSRLGIWKDCLAMVPDFPVLGSGLNTFPAIFVRYQTINKHEWVNAAHNDYLQALTDGGLVGLVIVLGLSVKLLSRARRGARSGVLGAGLLGSVLASCTHALVDFGWQIPAVAATFCLLAGLAAQTGGARLDPSDTGT